MARFERIEDYSTHRTNAPYRGLFTGARRPVLHDAKAARLLIDRAHVGTMVLGRVRSTGHDVPVLEDRYLSVIVPFSGKVLTEFRGREILARPGDAVVVSRGLRTTRVQGLKSADYQALVLMIDLDDLAALLAQFDKSGRPSLQRGDFALSLKSTQDRVAAQLITLVRLLAEDMAADIPSAASIEAQRGWQAILSEKLAALLRTSGHLSYEENPARAGRETHVRQGLDYIRENFADITTIAEVAEAAGISIRTLETAFRDLLDKSPLEVLTEWRMDEARRRLLKADDGASVTQIALDCGFGHTGRFATAYRHRFGERPSETLRSREI